jgi:hypothetical protein
MGLSVTFHSIKDRPVKPTEILTSKHRVIAQKLANRYGVSVAAAATPTGHFHCGCGH